MRARLAELVRRVLGGPLVVGRSHDAAGGAGRTRVHLPAAGADDAREPQQGLQRLHLRAADALPQPQHSRRPRLSGEPHALPHLSVRPEAEPRLRRFCFVFLRPARR